MSIKLPSPQARKPRPLTGLVGLTLAHGLPALPHAEVEAAAAYARTEKAVATRRAYATDFAIFRTWCADRGANALPAEPATVAAFLAWEASRTRPSTIGRRVAAIRYAHKLAGHEVPTDDERVRATMRGIRRSQRFRGKKHTYRTLLRETRKS